jgi:hypothetical protein
LTRSPSNTNEDTPVSIAALFFPPESSSKDIKIDAVGIPNLKLVRIIVDEAKRNTTKDTTLKALAGPS